MWVAAGIAFSRGPRALSLPSELIIYSIYKTLYVQNRKICKENKKEMWYSQTVLFYWKTTFGLFASWILSFPTTQKEELCDHFYLKFVLCAQQTTHCTIQNTDCPHGACKDTQLAQWQRSFAENLGQGGRSTQCPFTNSADPQSVKQHKHCATSTHFAQKTARHITVDISETQQPRPI